MTDYFVSKTGNNGNGLSLPNAKTTIAAGMALLSAGDRLLINDGTYAEPVDNIPSGISDITRTIIQAINNRQVIVTGTTSNAWMCEIESKNYITIDGLYFQASLSGLGIIVIGDSAGGFGGAASSYITIKNCRLYGGEYSITSHGVPKDNHHIVILDNLISNYGNIYPTYDGYDGHAIYPGWRDSLVEGNIIHSGGNNNPNPSGGGGTAIHQYDGSGIGGLHRNTYRRNAVYDCYGAGITLHQGDDCIIDSCMFYHNGLLPEGVGGIIINSTCNNAKIYGSLCYGNLDRGVWNLGINTIIKNTISYLNTNGNFLNNGSGTFDHNIGVESAAVDPKFIDGPNYDFHLQAISPCIDVAVDLGTSFNIDFDGINRPQGSGWDIGPLEFFTPVMGQLQIQLQDNMNREVVTTRIF